MRIPYRALLFTLGIGAVAAAQTTTTTPKKGEDPNVVEIRLADGSAVRMTLVQTHIDVVTRYGKLSVPVGDIKRIDFGFRYPDGAQAKIDEAVAQLGNANFRQREAAAAELFEFKELAYPALKRALKSTDNEIVKRAEEIVKKIEEKVSAERLKISENDSVQTFEFTIVGKIESSTLKARSPYFGEVSVQLAEARSLRSIRGFGEVEFPIDARYASPTEWLESEVEVSADDPLEIKASGQMLLRPGAGFESTPTGNQNYQNGNHASGQLLGRIGKSGKMFVVGENYRGTPGEAGRLFLRVWPSPWGNQATGSYNVKVTVGGAVEVRTPMRPTDTSTKDVLKK